MTTPINNVRTQERAKTSNEVFTSDEDVKKILNAIEKDQPELFTEPSKTILEPACGNGRFLTAILQRRLKMSIRNEFDIAKVLGSLYGIDIHASNIKETRQAMIDTINENHSKYCHEIAKILFHAIMSMNIICGDSTKILGDPDYYNNYDFGIPQPDPFEFKMEDKIPIPAKQYELGIDILCIKKE